jgi:hypothetical protein
MRLERVTKYRSFQHTHTQRHGVVKVKTMRNTTPKHVLDEYVLDEYAVLHYAAGAWGFRIVQVGLLYINGWCRHSGLGLFITTGARQVQQCRSMLHSLYCIFSEKSIRIHVFVRVRVRVCACVRVCVCVLCVSKGWRIGWKSCMWGILHSKTRFMVRPKQNTFSEEHTMRMRTRVHVCMCACVHTCVCVRACACVPVPVPVCACVCLCVCTRTCIYVCDCKKSTTWLESLKKNKKNVRGLHVTKNTATTLGG